MCLVIGPNLDVRSMISRSVLPATRARYESTNLDWLSFRTNDNGILHPDPYNLNGSNLSMVLLVLEYMVYLEKYKQYNGSLISRLLTGLGYHCKVHVVHASVMTHPSISSARQAIAPIVSQRNGADKIMGLNLEMLQWLRSTIWINGTIDQRMTSLFSRIHPTTFLYKRNYAKDLTEAIKASAVAFDFNPKSFRARSLR